MRFAGLLAAFPVHAARGQSVHSARNPGAPRRRRGRMSVAGPATPAIARGAGGSAPALRAIIFAEAQATARRGAACRHPGAVAGRACPATLARMERRGYDPFTPNEVAPWRRQLLIWRAARPPRRIFALSLEGESIAQVAAVGHDMRDQAALVLICDQRFDQSTWFIAMSSRISLRTSPEAVRGSSSVTCRCSGSWGALPSVARNSRRSGLVNTESPSTKA